MLAWSFTMNHCKSLQRHKTILGEKKSFILTHLYSGCFIVHTSHVQCSIYPKDEPQQGSALGTSRVLIFARIIPQMKRPWFCPLNLAEECAAAKSGQVHSDSDFPKAAGKTEEAKGEEDLWHSAAEGLPYANHCSQELLCSLPLSAPSSPRKPNWAPGSVSGLSQLLNRVMFQLPSSLKHPAFVFLEWKVLSGAGLWLPHLSCCTVGLDC